MRTCTVISITIALLMLAGAAFAVPHHETAVENSGYITDRTGGPDGGGYSYLDSDEDLGPSYSWVDISSSGTSIGDIGDDETVGPFSIGFDFPFYEGIYSEFYVCSNGFITFTGGQASTPYLIGNPAVGYPMDHHNEIQLMWSDLNPSINGDILYGDDGEGNLVIQYQQVAQASNPTENFTAEIILKQNGVIVLQYEEFSDGYNMDLEVIGIESVFDPSNTPYAYLGITADVSDYPHEGLAIEFAKPQIGSVGGTITDASTSNPIADAEVYIGNEILSTDANGEYLVEDLDTGLSTLSIFAPGYRAYGQAILIELGENIVDIELAPSENIALYEDFESSDDLFTAGGETPDAWEMGAPIAGPESAHSGTNAWATTLDGYYSGDEEATLATEYTWYVYSEHAQLTYYHWYDYQPLSSGNTSFWDGYNVQVSTDNGETWELLEPMTGYINTILSLESTEGFGGEEGQNWRQVGYNLNEYVGENVSFRFHHATNDYDSDYFGVAIDDLQLSGVQNMGGSIVDNDTNIPVSEAFIQVTSGVEQTIVAEGYSNDSGRFGIGVAEGNYSVSITKLGYRTVTYSSYSIEEGISNDLNIRMEPFNGVLLTGVLTSADTPDLAVTGAIVSIPSEGLAAVTDEEGRFNLGEYYPGTYTFAVTHLPVGSQGYHDTMIPDVVVDETTESISLNMLEILPPANFNASAGDGIFDLSWDLPLNHLSNDDIQARLNVRSTLLENLRQLQADRPERAQIADLEREVEVLGNHLTCYLKEAGSTLLDDVDNFRGFLLYMDGVAVNEHPMMETSLHFEEMQNSRNYHFELCADYGYPESYRVYELLDVRPLPPPDYEVTELTEIEWYELDPSEDGDGVSLGLGSGDYSGWISMGDLEFLHYGVPFNRFNVSMHGWLSFLHEWGAWPNSLHIPGNRPWGAIAPLWMRLDAGYTQEEDVWYKIDTENQRVVVQWHTGSDPGPLNNVKTFQAILNCVDNTVVFSFLDSEDGWEAEAGIGLKSNNGQSYVQYPTSNVSDNMSVKFVVDYADMINIHGTVIEAYSGVPAAGVSVSAVGDTSAPVITDEDGNFTIYALNNINSPFSIQMEGNGYLDTVVEDITVPDGEYETTVELTIYPIGTDVGPTILAVDGNHEESVSILAVQPDVGVGYGHLQHDNDLSYEAWRFTTNSENLFWMTPFIYENEEGLILTDAEIRLTYENDFFWPFPDENHDPIIVRIWANDTDDTPGEVLYESNMVRNSSADPFARVSPSIELPSNGFWLGFRPATGSEAIVVDDQYSEGPWMLYYTTDGGSTYTIQGGVGKPLMRADVVRFNGLEPEALSLTPRAPEQPAEVPCDYSNIVSATSGMDHIGILPRNKNRSRLSVNASSLFQQSTLDEFHGFNVYSSFNGEAYSLVNAEPIYNNCFTVDYDSENEGQEHNLYICGVIDTENGLAETVSSDTVIATFGIAPAPPSNLVATGSDPANLEITFVWDAPVTNEDGSELEDLGSYNIFRNGENVGTVGADVTTFTDQVEEGGYYTYWVTALDASGHESITSNTPLFRVGSPDYETSFEADDDVRFTASSTYWERGEITAGPESAVTGTNVWATDLDGNYGLGEYDWLRSDVIWPVQSENAMLSYYHYYWYESPNDGYVPLVSINGSDSWELLTPLNDYLSGPITGLQGNYGFTGYSDGWRKVFYDLGDYVGESIQIAFVHGTSSETTVHFGAAIDDLELWGVAPIAFGNIRGTVTDPSNNPIEGVAIQAQGLNEIIFTDAQGAYQIDDLFATNLRFTFEKENFWTQTLYVDVPEDGTGTLDVTMTYPDGEVSPTSFGMELNLVNDDSTASTDLTLSSSGSGELQYSVNLKLPSITTEENLFGDAISSFNANTATVEGRLIGAVATEDGFIVTAPMQHQHMVYSDAGVLQQIYDVPTEMWSRNYYGPSDIAYDVETGDIYGGNDDGDVYRYSVDFSSYEKIGQTDWWINALAYDKENQILYLNNWGEALARLDIESGEVEEMVNPLVGESIVGMCFMPTDPENCCLWMYSEGNNDVREYGKIFRYNPETGYLADNPIEIFGYNDGTASGISVTTLLSEDHYSLVTMRESSDGGILETFEGMWQEEPWIQIEGDVAGALASGSSSELTVAVDMRGRHIELAENPTIEGALIFSGENWPSAPQVAFTIEIFNTGVSEAEALPTAFSLNTCYPNPFNPSVTIPFDLPQVAPVRVAVYNLLGQEVVKLIDDVRPAGSHKITWDGRNAQSMTVGSGIYFVRMDSPGFSAHKKIVMLK